MDGREVIAGHSAGVTHELRDRRASVARAGGFSHCALLYRDIDEYLTGLTEFASTAAAAAASLQAVLPWTAAPASRASFPLASARATVSEMTELGRNPARLIPAGQAFADGHPGERVYCLWEPAWPRRSAAELREVARHEALCNLAFSDRPMTLLCLYDARGLTAGLIADVERTHPLVIAGGQQRPSTGYLGPGTVPPWCDEPLSVPGAGAESLSFTDRLGLVRDFSARHASAAGLSAARTRDLILAVSEVAANAIGYADGGVIRAWRGENEIICQVEDSGHIPDPLAGRRQRPPDSVGGHGLWLVNRLCDLVERRTGPAGTVTRLHMALRPAGAGH